MTGQRHDLGATFVRLSRAVVAAEQPVLDELGVEMWDYVVLSALQDGPAHSQARLAAATGRDTTRLIPILDRLEARGLLRRTPDPADRRNRIVELTDSGSELAATCQAAIRQLEARLLAGLPGDERAAFITTLERLAELIAAQRGAH
ncbi:MAG TPA: MarR family transcriptional regulator [Pseudonocardia sp.]|uniref:MarR family winged helix-turn-helix transcriptional regulator n=1 Tax=Pseudonocardia sp. TaxID=60912 RepID=UPI002B8C33FE|nr:MarR family transcriptional regulator [Pseudonocardia sp.]HTF53463.1 MarR family transcriptional regulator [Pseudonocardia sp.]